MRKRPRASPEERDAALAQQAKLDARVANRRAQVSPAQRQAELRSYEKRHADAAEEDEIGPAEEPHVDRPAAADAPSAALMCHEELEAAPANDDPQPSVGLAELIRIRASLAPSEAPCPEEVDAPELPAPHEMQYGVDLDEPQAPAAVNDGNELANAIEAQPEPPALEQDDPLVLGGEPASADGPSIVEYYRRIEASRTPLDWNMPIAEGHRMTLCDYLMGLLDVHVNDELTSHTLGFILSLTQNMLTGGGSQNVILPATRQEYEAAIRKLEDNTRFFLTCASHCQPCGRGTTHCPTCKKPTIVNGKPAGLFYVRDPRKWIAKIRRTPALNACLRYVLERLKKRTAASAAEDVWDGKLFEWLMKPNADPLRRPRDAPLKETYQPCEKPDDIAKNAAKWRDVTNEQRVFHKQSARAHIDLSKGDVAMMLIADGFRVFDTGEKSAWTANLAILNFAPELRMHPQLMFNLFGFSGSPAGSLEPFMRLALQPFIDSYTEDADSGRILLVLLGGDEAGIKKITGAMQHGSLTACECCHGAGVVPKNRSTAVYPVSRAQASRLTMDDYCAAIEALRPEMTKTQRLDVARQLGWKFKSCLTLLPYFHMIDSCVEDFLHRLSLGVCAQLTAATFARKDSKGKVVKVSQLQLPAKVASLVSERVTHLSAQLPQEYHTRLSAPVKSWPFYNGAQFALLTRLMPAALSISVAELKECVKDDEVDVVNAQRRVQTLMLLWKTLQCLVMECGAYTSEKARCERIAAFARDLNTLWEANLGELACTYNVHKVLHLHECIINVGPMPRYWAYPFERMNLEATKAVHRKDSISLQLALTAARKEAVMFYFLSAHVMPRRTELSPKPTKRIQELQELAAACSTGLYARPPLALEGPFAHAPALSVQQKHELAHFVAQHESVQKLSPQQARLTAELAPSTATYYSQCRTPYTLFKSCDLPHSSPQLTTSASRGAIVRVSFHQNGEQGVQWYYGILRFFAELCVPQCKVAYVDYFARARIDSPFLVQRVADKDDLSVRVVPIENLDCCVLLLPHAASGWLVVDALDKLS